MLQVHFTAGAAARPMESGFVITWRTWYGNATMYMILMAVVIFVVAALVLFAALHLWRNTAIWMRLYTFFAGDPPPVAVGVRTRPP